MSEFIIKKADFNLPKMHRQMNGGVNKSASEDKVVKTSINISENLYTRLKVLSAKQHQSISGLIAEAIEDLLSKNGE